MLLIIVSLGYSNLKYKGSQFIIYFIFFIVKGLLYGVKFHRIFIVIRP